MASELLAWLLEATIAGSAAILVVLLLRRPLCSAFGASADTTDGFTIALAQALEFMREKHLPAIIELKTDPEVITPNATLTAIRATARLAH